MIHTALNVGGSEWMIIIFVALILILGTGKLPAAARKLGKAVNEYNRAKTEISAQVQATSKSPKITGPVENEREKLDTIAKSIGIDPTDKSDEQLRDAISTKIGGTTKQNDDEPTRSTSV